MKYPLVAFLLMAVVMLTVISSPADASRRKLRIAKKIGALLLLHRKKYLFAVPFPLPVPVPVLKKTQPIIYKEKVAVPVPVPEPYSVPHPVPYEAPPEPKEPVDNYYPDAYPDDQYPGH